LSASGFMSPFAMEAYTLRVSVLPPLAGGGDAFRPIAALGKFAFSLKSAFSNRLIFLYQEGALFTVYIR
jgi:hypothetical protein